ncbi:glycosyltransferase [Desulfonatronum lacustre]|uniref:glycosyltransferase n=1 Tax=Desulfonatronum lacustre TaxID=66849 RepID=UPI0004BB26AF|nr:glycosyltransferase [Desulfonatronum lacustre]
MKIAYITTQFPAPSETFACSDVRVLNRLGVEIAIFTQKPAHRDFEEMVKDRDLKPIPITCCGIKNYILGLFACLRYLNSSIQLICWLVKNEFNKPLQLFKCLALVPASFFILSRIKEFNPSVVHLYWGHYPSIVGYLIRNKSPQIRISLFLGAYDLEMRLGISASLAKIADIIFTHTKANVETIKNLGVGLSRINVVHRGIDIAYLNSFLNEKKTKNNKILTAGRLIREKGFDKVINAFTIVLKRKIDAQLSIVGDGNFRNNLEKLSKSNKIQNYVKFYGHIQQQKLFQIMRNSDFFILLSYKKGERLPNVIKEAMFAKCICITSYTPGIEDLILHGKTGFIVLENEIEQSADIITKLSDSEKKMIGENAKILIEEKFNAEIQMKEYIDLWRH